jgi:hypothetical protein
VDRDRFDPLLPTSQQAALLVKYTYTLTR